MELCKHWVISEEYAQKLLAKHPGKTAEEIAELEGLDPQEWMDDEDVARESD